MSSKVARGEWFGMVVASLAAAVMMTLSVTGVAQTLYKHVDKKWQGDLFRQGAQSG